MCHDVCRKTSRFAHNKHPCAFNCLCENLWFDSNVHKQVHGDKCEVRTSFKRFIPPVVFFSIDRSRAIPSLFTSSARTSVCVCVCVCVLVCVCVCVCVCVLLDYCRCFWQLFVLCVAFPACLYYNFIH